MPSKSSWGSVLLWLSLLFAWAAPPSTAYAEPPVATSSAAAVAASDSPQTPVTLSLSEIPPDWGGRVRSFFGLLFMLGVAFLMSNNKRHVSWRLVATGIGLQIALGWFTRTDPGQWFFGGFNDIVVAVLNYTGQGASFLFGNLSLQNSVPVGPSVVPMPPEGPTAAWQGAAAMQGVRQGAGGPWMFAHVGAYMAFAVLPTIIFFSSLMAVAYHLGLMQLLVRGIAVVMQRTMRTSGAETLSAAGNIFVGQTEAPLLVRPFLKDLTQSELMAVMTGGFATVAGGVMVAYVGMLRGIFPEIAGHLLCASIMSAPAALVIAKIIMPEPDPSASTTFGTLKVELPSEDANVIDAAARGAGEGLKLALNVGAMLLAFIALVAMFNGLLGWVSTALGAAEPLTFQLLLGKVLAPVAWLMGVRWEDAELIGSLFGIKTVLNEFVAYIELAQQAQYISNPRSFVIAAYALCGFANFSSIAIQIGGISPLAPERRSDLARIGLRAMIGGTLAAFCTACVIGMLI